MKKKKVIVVALFAHIILWVVFMLASVVMRFTYSPKPGAEPLEIWMEKGIHEAFILVTLIGIISAASLFFSLRPVLCCPDIKLGKKRIAAICLSSAANIVFYLFVVLLFDLFGVPLSDKIGGIIALAWLLCEVCCGLLLFFSVDKKKAIS